MITQASNPRTQGLCSGRLYIKNASRSEAVAIRNKYKEKEERYYKIFIYNLLLGARTLLGANGIATGRYYVGVLVGGSGASQLRGSGRGHCWPCRCMSRMGGRRTPVARGIPSTFSGLISRCSILPLFPFSQFYRSTCHCAVDLLHLCALPLQSLPATSSTD